MAVAAFKFDGGRVTPFEERHLTQRYVDWLNDPEIVRFSEQRHRRHTLASCREYFESFRDSPNSFLAIESENDGLGHVGNMAVAVDLANRVADVSIVVGERKAWGTGIATRAWCGLFDALLREGRLRKITAGTMAANTPMLRLMERSGMIIEGYKRRQFLLDGVEVDLVYAARFA